MIMEDEKWQDLYLKEFFERNPELKKVYDEFRKKAEMEDAVDAQEKEVDKFFLNQIAPHSLATHFFS